MYICFYCSLVRLYILFQVVCPVGVSLSLLFKILYISFDPLLFFITGMTLVGIKGDGSLWVIFMFLFFRNCLMALINPLYCKKFVFIPVFILNSL